MCKLQIVNAIALSCDSSSGMMRYEEKEFPVIEIIGNVFAKGKKGLFYGESGLGKTTISIKLLNDDGIEPFLVDFDDNPSPKDMGTKHTPINGFALMKHDHNESSLDIPTNAVIIVDTYAYTRVASMIKDESGNLVDRFEEFIDALHNGGSNTIIIIAHNKDIATKRDIPDADPVWVNHLGFKLWLHEEKREKDSQGITLGKVKMFPAAVLTVKKLRGYRGDRDILMRWL